MDLPLGYHSKGESTFSAPMVCKLVKSFYGLKQASRQWNAKLSATISALGFKQPQADHSFFAHSSGSHFIALMIYVDDMIITGNDLACVANLKWVLDQKFGIKDLGSLKYFLRLEIARGDKGISINQRKYALDVLKEAGMLGCKPAKTQMEQQLKLSKCNGDVLKDVGQYRRLIEKLMYLTLSRPDITYAVHKISQFLAQPRVSHMKAATRILQYIIGTTGQGVFFLVDSDL